MGSFYSNWDQRDTKKAKKKKKKKKRKKKSPILKKRLAGS
jgi:hypothetical protein